MIDPGIIYAISPYKSNAELIEAAAKLGYLKREWVTLDPTYGNGTFWKLWRPEALYCHDLAWTGMDFTNLTYQDSHFDAVVFDPPYKLNGTPTPGVDTRYGVQVPTRWQDR